MHHLCVTAKFDNANQRFAVPLTHHRQPQSVAPRIDIRLMQLPADSHEIRDFGSLAVISWQYVGDVLQ